MKAFKELETEYKNKQQIEKEKIKQESNKFKRALKWIIYFAVFPFKWIWVNIRDYRTAIIFVIVFILVSSEVWVPYLLSFVFWNNETIRVSMLSVASACWLFWLSPGTPFLVICIGLTIGIKTLFNRLKSKKELHHS